MGNVKEKQVGEIFRGSQKLEIARDKIKNETMFHFNLRENMNSWYYISKNKFPFAQQWN